MAPAVIDQGLNPISSPPNTEDTRMRSYLVPAPMDSTPKPTRGSVRFGASGAHLIPTRTLTSLSEEPHLDLSSGSHEPLLEEVLCGRGSAGKERERGHAHTTHAGFRF